MKKKKTKPPTADAASQTDFPWTEEDERKERRRRKRERAEMRKQMYLMKKIQERNSMQEKASQEYGDDDDATIEAKSNPSVRYVSDTERDRMKSLKRKKLKENDRSQSRNRR